MSGNRFYFTLLWGHFGVHFVSCCSISLFLKNCAICHQIYYKCSWYYFEWHDLNFFLFLTSSSGDILEMFLRAHFGVYSSIFLESHVEHFSMKFYRYVGGLTLTNTVLSNLWHRMSLCWGQCSSIFGPILGDVSQCLEIFLAVWWYFAQNL